jgi:hypothetical protein
VCADSLICGLLHGEEESLALTSTVRPLGADGAHAHLGATDALGEARGVEIERPMGRVPGAFSPGRGSGETRV